MEKWKYLKRKGKYIKIEDILKNVKPEILKKYKETVEKYINSKDKNLRKICEENHVAVNIVSYMLKIRNIPIIGSPEYDLEKYKKALEEYKKGGDIVITDFCKEHNVSYNSFAKYLKDNGIHIINLHDRTFMRYEKILEEYKNGKSVHSLCVKYHMNSDDFNDFLESKNIIIEDRYHRIHFFDEHYLDIIDTEEKAFDIGFICADGCVYRGRLQIELQRSDREFLEKFAKRFNVPIRDDKHRGGIAKGIHESSVIAIHSKTLTNALIEKEIKPRKSSNLTGKVFDYIPENLWYHVVRGFFDGDGCIHLDTYSNKYRMSFVGTKSFLTKIASIFTEKIGTNINEPKKRKNHNYYTLSYGGSYQLMAIRDWLYKDAAIFLERKKKIFDEVKLSKNIRNKSSKYRGVSFNKKYKKWVVRIKECGKSVYLKYFDTEIEAARDYNKYIIDHNLPRYMLNKIEG